MSIKRIIADKTDIEIDLVDLFTTFFNIESIFAQELYDTQLRSHIDQLRDDVSFFVEAPYIDKVYRDSFYSYFSSKLGNYKKDCIRISIFNGPLIEELFSEVAKFKELSDNYLGFMVVRL
ncbi:MAG: hypothetical protein Q8J87_01225 [Sediminibacterium sp.]|nr:hypothetical protein [Sediminibacterium sp.]